MGKNSIMSVTFFSNPEDLENITKLSSDILWEAGFNLDDMDCGLFFNKTEDIDLVRDEDLVVGGTHYKRWKWKTALEELNYSNNIPYGLYKLLQDWDNYCVGYHLAKIGDTIFVTLHHA